MNINPARGLHLEETGILNKIINNIFVHVVLETTGFRALIRRRQCEAARASESTERLHQ